MKVEISSKEIKKLLDIETPEFPKYSTRLVNLANQLAQGTRPRIVDQMTELIQQFTGKELPEWEKWYLEQKPDAIGTATEKIFQMLKNFRNTIDKIDQTMVEQWARDLVIVKTFVGLRLQEAILKKGAEIKKTEYRLSEPDEESKGIDGYIGAIPVSIKPHTYYEAEASLPENIEYKTIYYKKVKDGVEVDYGDIL
jgi:hypothetical protein